MLLAVQERRRFYREAMTACLRDELGTHQVAGPAADAGELLALAGAYELTHVVVEADLVPWDVASLATALKTVRPALTVIGLAAAPRRSGWPGVTVVARSASPAQLAQLVQPGADREPPFILSAGEAHGNGVLTAQQLKVLALLSLGLTASEVASRLGLSERGVAKSKAAIFSKLGVQSQAQAVAAALAGGLLGPAPVVRPA
jgi:DNA-binding NarL/FixJ family response regulator